MPSLTDLALALQTLLNDQANLLARQLGLVRRASRLSGALLLQILVFGLLEQPTASYNYLAQVALDFGLVITPQGLHKRLKRAAPFMRALCQHSLALWQAKSKLPVTALAPFEGFYLHDSTQLALPDQLASAYPGSGGSGPKASLKLQTSLNLLNGQITHLSEQAGRQSDQGYRAYLDQLKANSLIIFDLGYWVLASFKQVVAQKAYFICRASSTAVYYLAGSEQRLDVLAYLQTCQSDEVELDVLVGASAKIGCRLIAKRRPPLVVAQRQQQLKKKGHKRGRAHSAKQLEWQKWAIYLSNVPVEYLSGEQICQCYRLRWQIELWFKLAKSLLELDRVIGRVEGAVISQIYAKLIGLSLFNYLSGPVRLSERVEPTEAEAAETEGCKELSLPKALQTLKRRAIKLGQGLVAGVLGQVVQNLRELYEEWGRFGLKNRRRKRLSSLGQLDQAGRVLVEAEGEGEVGLALSA